MTTRLAAIARRPLLSRQLPADHLIAIQPLSGMALSHREESGETARAWGLIPERTHQRSAEPVAPYSVRFVHPPFVQGQRPLPVTSQPRHPLVTLPRQRPGSPWRSQPPSAA